MVKERDGRERVRDKNVEFFLCGTIWTNVKIVCGGISVFATYGGMCITALKEITFLFGIRVFLLYIIR